MGPSTLRNTDIAGEMIATYRKMLEKEKSVRERNNGKNSCLDASFTAYSLSFNKFLSPTNPMAALGFSASSSSAFPSLSSKPKRPNNSFQVRSVAAPAEDVAGFDEMVSGTERKYYMLGGKGGVGKTSCAASLAVKFANNGHPTLVVSTDPAHSLPDSFAQDLTRGMLVPVEGPDFPLFALEINPEKTREEFRDAAKNNGGTGVKDFMDGMGLGMLAEQLGELKLGELLDTPPPGLEEVIAISKVMQFLESPQYSMFTRMVFDTAPTGHTLRLVVARLLGCINSQDIEG
ncbi:ATPase GET3B-like [Hibiscus syriacus]|uniref:ATPase GET3B-like n=1 Tax=Hibiscus syriacus TaxID=106335 RepID=UPI00192359E7|nr:ATPase GET3B-like [Hibiscus syriacus]